MLTDLKFVTVYFEISTFMGIKKLTCCYSQKISSIYLETIVFLFLGMAVVNAPHYFDIRFISWSMVC